MSKNDNQFKDVVTVDRYFYDVILEQSQNWDKMLTYILDNSELNYDGDALNFSNQSIRDALLVLAKGEYMKELIRKKEAADGSDK